MNAKQSTAEQPPERWFAVECPSCQSKPNQRACSPECKAAREARDDVITALQHGGPDCVCGALVSSVTELVRSALNTRATPQPSGDVSMSINMPKYHAAHRAIAAAVEVCERMADEADAGRGIVSDAASALRAAAKSIRALNQAQKVEEP